MARDIGHFGVAGQGKSGQARQPGGRPKAAHQVLEFKEFGVRVKGRE